MIAVLSGKRPMPVPDSCPLDGYRTLLWEARGLERKTELGVIGNFCSEKIKDTANDCTIFW